MYRTLDSIEAILLHHIFNHLIFILIVSFSPFSGLHLLLALHLDQSLGRESNSQRGSQIPQIGSWGKGRQGPQSSRFLPTEYKSTIHTGTQQDTRTKRREAGTDEHARTLGSDPQIPTMFHDRDTTLPRLPGTEELEYYSAQQRRVSQQIASLKVEEFGLRISTACNDGDNEEDTQLVARPHATDIGTWTTRETSKENPQSHWGSVSGSGSGGSGSGSAGAESKLVPQRACLLLLCLLSLVLSPASPRDAVLYPTRDTCKLPMAARTQTVWPSANRRRILGLPVRHWQSPTLP